MYPRRGRRSTHGGVYKWRSVRTRGRLNKEKNPHREEYTQRRIHAGEEEYTPWSVHMEESIHGRVHAEESIHGFSDGILYAVFSVYSNTKLLFYRYVSSTWTSASGFATNTTLWNLAQTKKDFFQFIFRMLCLFDFAFFVYFDLEV